MIDFLVVGSGIFGATCARLLSDAGKSVRVLERRNHMGGNCFDEPIDDQLVNRYGGHIFHTNSRKIWDFVNRFSAWRAYEHRVKARVGWKIYSFPVNLMTLQQIYGVRSPAEAQAIMPDGKLTDRLYKMFYEGYSFKQWGGAPPPGVIERIPVRMTWDDRYYSDKYQAVPERGYTELIKEILRTVPVIYETDYVENQEYWNKQARQIIYSGSLDALYGNDLGELPYWSLTWRNETMSGDFQGCATVNYCDIEIPFTRILEWQHYGHRSRAGTSIITFEYPAAFLPGANEPHYPITSNANRELYKSYRARVRPGVWVGGRLGSYQYLNMDQTIGQAMRLVEDIANETEFERSTRPDRIAVDWKRAGDDLDPVGVGGGWDDLIGDQSGGSVETG
jgi:UDP-galactopyranose mutase